jgi:hypothetical protein
MKTSDIRGADPSVSSANRNPFPRVWMFPLGAIGLICLSLWFRSDTPRIFAGINDFMGIYAASRLVGTPEEFDRVAYLREQLRATAWTAPSIAASSRLPAFAFVLRPLGKLKYLRAYTVWQGLSLASLVVFFVIWPTPDRGLLLFAGCWSFPLFADLAGGQDVALLLLIVAIAWCCSRASPFLAGAVLALATLKFHLFLLIPIFLIAQRRWRTLIGASLATGLILAGCFAAAGRNWVPRYVHVIMQGQTNPNVRAMPNLHGLLEGLPRNLAWEVVGAVLIATAVFWIARRAHYPVGFSVALVGSLLVSHHAYAADMLLLLPALLILSSEVPSASVRFLCLLLLSPLPFLITPVVPLAGPLPLLLVALLIAVTAHTARRQRPINISFMMLVRPFARHLAWAACRRGRTS